MRKNSMRLSPLWLLLGMSACAAPSRLHLSVPSRPQLSNALTMRVADAALAGGAPAMALRVTREILAKHPRNVQAMVGEGDALYAMGRGDAAAGSYRRALAIRPHDIQARLGLGRTRLRTDAAGAEAMFQAVVAFDSANAAAWNDLGIARDLQGRHAAAQEAYERALGVDPDMIAAQVNLGFSLAIAGHGSRAVGILRPLAESSAATPRIRQDLAVALAVDGQPGEASEVLRADLSQTQAADALSVYQRFRPTRID